VPQQSVDTFESDSSVPRASVENPEEVDWNEPLSDDEEYDLPVEPEQATDEDDGLAIAIGSRRGRKGSMLER
jgi:hypothetical protein